MELSFKSCFLLAIILKIELCYLSKCICKLVLEFSYTLVHHGCTFGMKYCEKSNAGIVSSVSKASSVSNIYIKSCYSTLSNAQYCKNASNISTGER